MSMIKFEILLDLRSVFVCFVLERLVFVRSDFIKLTMESLAE